MDRAGVGAADLTLATTIIEKYRDQSIGVADASTVVLADRYRPQLEAYASALRAATGIEVAATLLCVARADGSPALTVAV